MCLLSAKVSLTMRVCHAKLHVRVGRAKSPFVAANNRWDYIESKILQCWLESHELGYHALLPGHGAARRARCAHRSAGGRAG